MIQSKTHSQHLFADVPFSQLLDQDLAELNENELVALGQKLRGISKSPHERKAAKKSDAANIKKGKPSAKKNEDISHLL